MNADVSSVEPPVVSVMEDVDLPDMCAICAAHTTRRQRINSNYFNNGEPPKQGTPWSGLLGLAGLVMGRQERKDSLKKETCVIYLPVCESCSKIEIKPLRVNFHFKKMSFAVHQDFKNAVDALPKSLR